PQAQVRGRVPDRAPRRRRPPRLRPPLPRRPRGPARGERARDQTVAGICDRARREAHGRAVERVRLRRAARQPLLHGRGVPAERQPHLSRGARPRRGRHARHRLPLAPSRGGDCHPAAGQHPRLLRAERDRPLPPAALRADHPRLQPGDAVHPRRGRGRGRRARAADERARCLQCRRPGRRAAEGRDPRDRPHGRPHPGDDRPGRAMLVTALLYRYWFRLETQGIANIPPGRLLLISNHAGQIALDAAMISCACLLEAEPPRVIRGMGEYWLPTVPWVNELMVRTGSVVGTRKNCIDLLENEEAVIAFPEGVRGMNKLIWERYQLQEFGQGFMRLALETHTPIVPIAVVGSEEQAPAIANVRSLARLLRLPAFPVTLTWPLLGPLGLVPLPVKYRITFGEPMTFEGNPSDEDEVIGEKVEQVKASI